MGLLVIALVGTAASLTIGLQTLASPRGTMYGLPPFPYFMFGAVGLVSIVGDVHVIRFGARQGRPRLARHLWRMCWALWIATSSFFLGQAKVGDVLIATGRHIGGGRTIGYGTAEIRTTTGTPIARGDGTFRYITPK